jgi:hypothetical protein
MQCAARQDKTLYMQHSIVINGWFTWLLALIKAHNVLVHASAEQQQKQQKQHTAVTASCEYFNDFIQHVCVLLLAYELCSVLTL